MERPAGASPHRAAWWVAGVLAVAVAVVLTVLASQHWFFADDWTFVNRAGADELNLWVVPYSGHWMAATVAWFAAMQSLVGLDSYLPYVLPAIVCHVVTGLLLWRWQVRDGVHPWLALAVVAPFLVLGVAWENVFFAVNLGFNASLALAVGFGLLVDVPAEERSTPRLVAAGVLALASIVTTTTGPLIVAAVAAALAVRRDWWGLAVGAGPAVVGYAAWLLLAEGGGGLEGGPLGAVIAYVARLGLSGAGRPLGLTAPWLAGVVLAGLGAAAVIRRGGPRPRVTTVALAATAVAFTLATALARLKFGESTWQSPRYLYAVAAMAVPMIGVLVARVVRGVPALRLVAVAALLLAAGVNADALRDGHQDSSGIKEHLRVRHLAAAQLLERGLEPVPINVDRYWSPNLHWTHLLDYVEDGDIDVPEDPVGDPWRLEAEIELRSVLHGPQPFDTLSDADLEGAGSDGCRTVAPGEEVTLGLTGPTGLSFEFDTPTIARLQTRTDDGRTTAIPRLLDLRTPSPRSWWVSLDDRVTMTLTVDDGARVCVLDEGSARAYDGTEPG